MKPRRARTWQVWLAAALFALAAFFGFSRAYQSLLYSDLLAAYRAQPAPPYGVVTGLLWGLAGLLASFSVWSGWHARRIAYWTAGGMAVTYWADRLLFSQSSAARANTPFAAFFSLCLLVFVIAAVQSKPPREGKSDE
ncbi:hypothetical protein [Levilinea saccharolytica]|uniref:Uncharacterized protein n=1 Tax=Levilinea saccharolytica TaxID=229921 RepID=A0A0M8JPZ3_9CHLR|nr:hypothetical protein [Levilinea saccharolytica]KPL80944.1 hypothetical protein ADN01_10695 [Levilinea saccharolytica]GAP19269.1 hypothetical protein LSAC_03170 [Levilinea saccharolytica]